LTVFERELIRTLKDEGKSGQEILQELKAQGIKSPVNEGVWTAKTINRIAAMAGIGDSQCENDEEHAISSEGHSSYPTPVEWNERESATRSPFPWLWIGIILCPAIFAWFTLGKSRSINERAPAFIWLFIYIILFAGSPSSNNIPSVSITSTSNSRTYSEKDFYWNNDTSKYKSQITEVINKISRENNRCGHIDPESVTKSPERSRPGDPVFWVTCGEGINVFNVWFRPTDAKSDAKFEPAKNISRDDAISECEKAVKAESALPSTVYFSYYGLQYTPYTSGNTRIVSTFTSKNAFNLETKHQINCLFEENRLVEHHISESIK